MERGQQRGEFLFLCCQQAVKFPAAFAAFLKRERGEGDLMFDCALSLPGLADGGFDGLQRIQELTVVLFQPFIFFEPLLMFELLLHQAFG